MMLRPPPRLFFFFFNDTATTEIYTLSLHDALPISLARAECRGRSPCRGRQSLRGRRASRLPRYNASSGGEALDRKSTRLNSSHQIISYAVFCLKKKKQTPREPRSPSRDCAKQHTIH